MTNTIKLKTILVTVTLAIFNQAVGQDFGVPELVHESNPSGDGGASNMTSVGDNLYYEANGTLWVYDGSSVSEVNLSGVTYGQIIGQLNSEIYFTASEAGLGLELYRNDGNSTILVADINPSGDSEIEPNSFAVFQDKMIFVADDGSFGQELWMTDGTTTSRISDIATGATSSYPENLKAIDTLLYFTAIEGGNRELYAYTSTEVIKINADAGYESVPDREGFSIAAYNNTLYFTAYDMTSGNNIWLYDGSEIRWFDEGLAATYTNGKDLHVTTVDSRMYWIAENGSGQEAILNYNGSTVSATGAGTIESTDIFHVYKDKIVFKFIAPSNGLTWFTTWNGSVALYDVNFAETSTEYVGAESTIYYLKELLAGSSYELGTMDLASGADQVYDVNPTGTDLISGLAIHQTTLFFEGDDGTSGRELFKLRALNNAPEIINPVTDFTAYLIDGSVTIDMADAIYDPDGDDIQVRVISFHPEIITTSQKGTTVTLHYQQLGTARIKIWLEDEFNRKSENNDFYVTLVTPYLTYGGEDFVERGNNIGEIISGFMNVRIDGDTFANAGGTLEAGTHYNLNNLPEGLTSAASVNSAGDSVKITLAGQAVNHDYGNDVNLEITFTDAAFARAEAASVTNAVAATTGVKVDFNRYHPIELIYPLEELTRTTTSDTVFYTLGYSFDNPGNYDLTAEAVSSDESVATATITHAGNYLSGGYTLEIIPLSVGSTTVTVTATTEYESSATFDFNVEVVEPSLDYSMDIGYLDDLQLTYEGKRAYYQLVDYEMSPDGSKIIHTAPTFTAYQEELNQFGNIAAGATSHEYDNTLFPFNITAYAFRPFGHVSGGSRSVAFSKDGTKLYVSGSNNLYMGLELFSLSEPFNLRSDYTLVHQLDSRDADDEFYDLSYTLNNMVISEDGLSIFHYVYADREIKELRLAAPHDLSGGLTEGAVFSVAELSEPYSYRFSDDGMQLYVFESDIYTVQIYDLPSPYNIADSYTDAGTFTIDPADMEPEGDFYTDNFHISKNKKKLYVVSYDDRGNYLHQYAITNASSGFTEMEANDGALSGKMVITSAERTFINISGTLEHGNHYSIANLPEGLTPVVAIDASGYQAQLTFEGKASKHNSLYNINDIHISFTGAAFESGDVGGFVNAVGGTGFGIEFVGDGEINEIAKTACEYFLFDGDRLTRSDTYEKLYAITPTYDSLVILNLTILDATSSEKTVKACELYEWNGQTFTTPGTYQELFTNAAGCDSTATLNLTILQPTTSEEEIAVCESYEWNGTTFTTSGTYQELLTNAAGCDSTATLNLTILEPTAGAMEVSVCGSYIWEEDEYTASGSYEKTLVNAAGCDSTATLDLTILSSSLSLSVVQTCDSYEWGGSTYTESGSFELLLTNTLGCDSTALLTLIIEDSTSGAAAVEACGSYEWEGSTYDASGSYETLLANSVGCDSTATLDLTVLPEPTAELEIDGDGLTLTEMNAGDTYQWYDCSTDLPISGATEAAFKPIENGEYYVEVSNGLCTVTSLCAEATFVITALEDTPSPEIRVYPNPTSDKVQIELGDMYEKFSIEVMTLTGQLIQQQEMLMTDRCELDFSGRKGMVLIRVSTSEEVLLHSRVLIR
ncbi:MAG: hypothetical protein RIF33_08765 [Cyclobacteriaceae bacterium]